jgi:hypothetical protein
VSANFFKKTQQVLPSNLNTIQYTAGGIEGLMMVKWKWKLWKGEWQGYQNQDFEAVIDLQEVQDISSISANFFTRFSLWILMPQYVQFILGW